MESIYFFAIFAFLCDHCGLFFLTAEYAGERKEKAEKIRELRNAKNAVLSSKKEG